MANIAVLGHGVVGSGVLEVLTSHAASIAKRAKEEIHVKYILDLKEFPGLPYSDRFTKDFNVILNDPEVQIVVEVMGGLHPAYDFVKACLENGKSVVTSNKELVAQKGAELLAIAQANNLNFLFEASVGGGIPIIRPISQCLAANDVTEIAGILNGTTNYMLTRMGEDGNATAEIAVAVKSEALNPRTSRIHYQLLTPTGENAAAGQKDVTLDMRREDTLRFLARIPANLLWSAELPTQYTLRLKTQHEGRYVEYLELRLGFRSVEMQDGRMSLNARPVTLRVREVPAAITENEIAALREQGFNTLKLLPGPVPESLLNFCDVQGLYVIAQAPIDTRRSGESRRKGGNPSNDPEWQPAYLERTENSYHTTKRHPSVVAFALATQSANGINLYESYLNMKRFGDSRPFIYPDAGGEWDSDKLALE